MGVSREEAAVPAIHVCTTQHRQSGHCLDHTEIVLYSPSLRAASLISTLIIRMDVSK